MIKVGHNDSDGNYNTDNNDDNYDKDIKTTRKKITKVLQLSKFLLSA